VTGEGQQRFAMLDGWRAVSILLVLAGHLVPLGAASINAAVAASGMAIFFILSGFLITQFLLRDLPVRDFLIRRLFRIVPLAWLAIIIALPMADATGYQWLSNLFFFANLPPFGLVHSATHLWSLSLEVQFYLFAAATVVIAGVRGIIVFPLVGVAVTLFRIWSGVPVSIVTWLRIDEILAGSTLALAHAGLLGRWLTRIMKGSNVVLFMPLLLLSAHPVSGPLMYARPYIAMLMVGSSIYSAPRIMERLFASRAAAYIATISYALYIVHGVLRVTWLGSGSSSLIRLAKRPLLLGVTFALAHLSTFRFEQPWIAFAKRLSARGGGPKRAGALEEVHAVNAARERPGIAGA
jgi:peptidoglycan/LPS O-acetylase OafA/YrhL